jgi:phage tail tape-measure protein
MLAVQFEGNEYVLKDAYDALKAKYEELLSYLPKVPAQPYEKELAKQVVELQAKLEQAEAELAKARKRYMRKGK